MAVTDWSELLLLKLLRAARRMRLDRLMRIGGATYSFTDCFKGFEKVEVVRSIFGEKTEEALRNLKVEFTWLGGYMWVNGADGHLMISSRYLRDGNKLDIYLDLVHELVHVKQFMDGKELFDSNYNYVDRPTEVEAYGFTVKEARRLGLSDQGICDYLRTEWMSDADLKKLAEALDVTCA